VNIESDDKMEIVIHEILQDKIFLTTKGELKMVGETPDLGELLDLDVGDS
jgi:hypothetical protein